MPFSTIACFALNYYFIERPLYGKGFNSFHFNYIFSGSQMLLLRLIKHHWYQEKTGIYNIPYLNTVRILSNGIGVKIVVTSILYDIMPNFVNMSTVM